MFCGNNPVNFRDPDGQQAFSGWFGRWARKVGGVLDAIVSVIPGETAPPGFGVGSVNIPKGKLSGIIKYGKGLAPKGIKNIGGGVIGAAIFIALDPTALGDATEGSSSEWYNPKTGKWEKEQPKEFLPPNPRPTTDPYRGNK